MSWHESHHSDCWKRHPHPCHQPLPQQMYAPRPGSPPAGLAPGSLCGLWPGGRHPHGHSPPGDPDTALFRRILSRCPPVLPRPNRLEHRPGGRHLLGGLSSSHGRTSAPPLGGRVPAKAGFGILVGDGTAPSPSSAGSGGAHRGTPENPAELYGGVGQRSSYHPGGGEAPNAPQPLHRHRRGVFSTGTAAHLRPMLPLFCRCPVGGSHLICPPGLCLPSQNFLLEPELSRDLQGDESQRRRDAALRHHDRSLPSRRPTARDNAGSGQRHPADHLCPAGGAVRPVLPALASTGLPARPLCGTALRADGGAFDCGAGDLEGGVPLPAAGRASAGGAAGVHGGTGASGGGHRPRGADRDHPSLCLPHPVLC